MRSTEIPTTLPGTVRLTLALCGLSRTRAGERSGVGGQVLLRGASAPLAMTVLEQSGSDRMGQQLV